MAHPPTAATGSYPLRASWPGAPTAPPRAAEGGTPTGPRAGRGHPGSGLATLSGFPALTVRAPGAAARRGAAHRTAQTATPRAGPAASRLTRAAPGPTPGPAPAPPLAALCPPLIGRRCRQSPGGPGSGPGSWGGVGASQPAALPPFRARATMAAGGP